MTRPRVAMDIVLTLAGAYVVFTAFIGFLGQLYFGKFSLSDTATSISALLAVLLAAACRGVPKCRMAVVVISAMSLACVALGAIEYYRLYDIPGNDYAWELRIPFIVCLVLLGCAGFFIPSEP